jgi:hypothetical protein
VPPPKTIRPPKSGPTDHVAELAILAALIALLHLFWPAGHSRGAEAVVAAVLVALWGVWRLVQALKPRQRVMTWSKPRGADAINPGIVVSSRRTPNR